nr:amidophosphoribosyltransferase [bacterium]
MERLTVLQDKPQDHCGIFGAGLCPGQDAAPLLYEGLFALQHRGQESAGIAAAQGGRIGVYKDVGLVTQAIPRAALDALTGNMAIGHVRYSTTGRPTRDNAQPLVVRMQGGGMLAVAHNGNLSNAQQVKARMQQEGIPFETQSDTEVIALGIAREIARGLPPEEAVRTAMQAWEGSYSLVILTQDTLLAVRDPLGIRPLCMGRKEGRVVFASESCALTATGCTFERDIRPGEIVQALPDGSIRTLEAATAKRTALCSFEPIYFARPDSIIDGQSVYHSRFLAGAELAHAYPVEADLVAGVPDSGLIAALGYAKASGIPYGDVLNKNRYVGRTFIQPNPQDRTRGVRLKLSPIPQNVAGKRIVLIDDSIVRGTTITQLVALLRRAGALQVHIRIASPPFLHPCLYGIDVPTGGQLVAAHVAPDTLAASIGADSLGFLPLGRLKAIAPDCRLDFCDACFSGRYPYPIRCDNQAESCHCHPQP